MQNAKRCDELAAKSTEQLAVSAKTAPKRCPQRQQSLLK